MAIFDWAVGLGSRIQVRFMAFSNDITHGYYPPQPYNALVVTKKSDTRALHVTAAFHTIVKRLTAELFCLLTQWLSHCQPLLMELNNQ